QMFGSMITPAANYLILPKPSEIKRYLDWRSIINISTPQVVAHDFVYSINLAKPTFQCVIDFLENEWQNNLL
ncbi:MAG TPA: hypothetical protein PK950_02805, partial [Candidatus Paceibacterota bacterium]|nr:hypothetical protein [Candidatus Paceibacterota bacterium]